MKLIALIVTAIFAPALAMAQDAAKKETAPIFLHDNTADLTRPVDAYQIAYADTTAKAIVKQNALDAALKFIADPDLYSATGRTGLGSTIVTVWRDRVFRSLSADLGPRLRDGSMYGARLMSNTEFEELANDRRMAAKIVLRETVRYSREQLPEIDRLINALKFEVSNGSVAEYGVESEQKHGGHVAADNNTADKEGLFLKTGLRLPIEGGKVSLVSESEVKYGSAASFITINLDGQYDRSAGITYAFGKELRLQIERQDSHLTDPVSGDRAQARSSLGMIRVVYVF